MTRQSDYTTLALLTTWAQQGQLSAFPVVPLAAVHLAAGDTVPMPRVRHARPGRLRRAARVTAAVCKLAAKRMPRWALPVMALMAVIPLDPFDELPLLPIVVWVAVRHRAEFATVAREAWSR